MAQEKGKLLIRDRVFYSTATLGKEISNGMINTYFMLYLTCLMGLNGIAVGFAMCAVRLATVAFDPIMATIVNNTKTKLGKFRPWLLIGAVINTGVLVATFVPLTNAAVAWKYVYYLILYALWSVSYSMIDVPIMSMVPSLANSNSERESISSLSRLVGGFGGFIIGSGGALVMGFLPNKDANPQNYMIIALVGGIILIASMLLFVIICKERYDIPCENIKLKTVFELFKTNDQARTFSICNLLFTVGANIAVLQLVYLFIYQPYLDFTNTYIIFQVVACTGQGIAMIFYGLITKKLPTQKVFGLTYVFSIIGFALMFGMFFVVDVLAKPWINVIILALAGSLLMIANGMNQISSMVMLTDVSDYAEYKFGKRSDSAVMSLMSILTKTSAALATLVLGIAVAVSGVPEIDLMTNKFSGEVTTNMLIILRVFMFLLPIPLMPIGMIIYKKKYKLSGAYLQEVKDGIAAKRANGNVESEEGEVNGDVVSETAGTEYEFDVVDSEGSDLEAETAASESSEVETEEGSAGTDE